MNHEEIFCKVRTVNTFNCAIDPLNICEMSSEIILDPTSTMLIDEVNSSFYTGVLSVSEKKVIVQVFLKTVKLEMSCRHKDHYITLSFCLRYWKPRV